MTRNLDDSMTCGASAAIAPDVAIRASKPSDLNRLRRLAALDSQPAPRATDSLLLAEIDGELWAAVSLDGSRRLADPLKRSAWLVDLLELRAAQLRRGVRLGSGRGARRHLGRRPLTA